MKKIFLLLSVWFLVTVANANGPWRTFNDLNAVFPSNIVVAVEFDSDNTIWLGSVYGGVAHYIPWQTTWIIYNDTTSSMPSNEVRSIALANDGTQWFGTKLGLVHKVGEQLTVYTTSNSNLPNDKINLLRKDVNGTIWAGTDGGGIVKIPTSGAWEIINTSNSGLPDNKISSLEFQGSTTWIGTTNGGLAKLDGANWTVYNQSNGDFLSDRIYALGIQGNDVFARLAEKPYKLNNNTWDTLTGDFGLPNFYNRKIVFDNDGKAWFDKYFVVIDTVSVPDSVIYQNQYALQSYNGTEIDTIFTSNNSGIAASRVFSLHMDGNGTLWIGCLGATAGRMSLYNRTGVPDFVASIDDVFKSNEFTVFPNPSSDFVNFDIANDAKVKVYDVLGNLISEVQGGYQNISSWKAGIYILECEKNGLLRRTKLLKI